MVDNAHIQSLIEEALPGASVTLIGEGCSIQAQVITEAFEGKALLARHRMVYAALGDLMKEELHALSIKAYTPEEINQ